MSMIERLESMLAKGRDDATLRFGLGSAYSKEGNLDEAVTHLEACIRHDPNYSAAYKLLGRAIFELGDLDGAVAVFERGLLVAEAAGDKQSEREIGVFLRKISKAGGSGSEKTT